MRKYYLAGVVALSLSFGAAVARAQDYYQRPKGQPPEGAGTYFRLAVGPSFFQNGQLTQFGSPVSSLVKYRTGLAAEGALGYAFNKYVAAGLEVGYTGAKIDYVPGYYSRNSYIYNVPFLANITLSYPLPRSFLEPYIGAGVGGADVIFDTDNFNDGFDAVVGQENDVVFAWQAFAGVRFRLARNFSLGFGYKFLTTDNPTFTYPPDNFAVRFDGVKAHSIMFALQWKF